MNNLNPPDSVPQADRRPIPDYEGYEIDRCGNVYAMFKARGQEIGRQIKSRVTPEGYVTVSLSKDGKWKTRTIHRLLMLTFKPVENSRELEVNHIDGNRANNDLSNLEWLTHTDNMLHSHYVLKSWSRMPHGERSSDHKLTEDQVRTIRALLAEGKMLQRDIAQQYGVSQAAISQILIRKTWKRLV